MQSIGEEQLLKWLDALCGDCPTFIKGKSKVIWDMQIWWTRANHFGTGYWFAYIATQFVQLLTTWPSQSNSFLRKAGLASYHWAVCLTATSIVYNAHMHKSYFHIVIWTFKNRLLQLCPWELPTHGWGSSQTCKMPTNLRLTILAPKILRKSAWIVTKRKSQKLYVISFCSQFSPKFFHYSL